MERYYLYQLAPLDYIQPPAEQLIYAYVEAKTGKQNLSKKKSP